MRGQPSISRIYRLAVPDASPDPERSFARIWRRCRDMWALHGTIVAKPDELPEHLRDALIDWANDQYGERRNGRR